MWVWEQGVCVVLACLTLLYLAPSRCVAGPSTVPTRSKDDNSAPTPVLAQEAGYTCETHSVMTPDGYILTLHRIFGPRGRSPNRDLHPVFLMHGIMGSSADWVLKGYKQALAFLLADKRYDVWLGNARGNIYSRVHKTLPADDVRYWNFSWHEIGHQDLPVCIDHVLKVTGHSKVNYIGYSMGTTVLFVFLSMWPQYNEKICSVTALAPVVFMKYVTTSLRLTAPESNVAEIFAETYNGELSPRTPALNLLLKLLCENTDAEKIFCENVLFVLCGYSPIEADKNLLPKILGHTPAGTSIRTTVHYGQIINAIVRFQWFDYGPHGNRVAYHSVLPPEYNLRSVTTPVALVYGYADKIATPLDVIKLHKILKNPDGLYLVNQTFNHLDFIYGKYAKDVVYDLVIKHLEKYKDRCTPAPSVTPTKRYRNGVRCD